MSKLTSKSLSTMLFDYKDIVKKSVENIQEELISEQVEVVRDYIKASFRMKFELEKQIKDAQVRISQIDSAVEATKNGSLEEIKALKIPTRFLSEKTARLNGLDWDQEEK